MHGRRLSGLGYTRHVLCSYQDADYLNIFTHDHEEPAQLERLRPQLFELKNRVLSIVAQSLSQKSDNGLWERCIQLLTESLNAENVHFLFKMDSLYLPLETRLSGSVARTSKMIPGGLTDLLEVIGHCEKEIRFRTLDTVARVCRDLLDVDRVHHFALAHCFPEELYFKCWDSTDRDKIHSAIDCVLDTRPEEAAFWDEYRNRLNGTEQEFSSSYEHLEGDTTGVLDPDVFFFEAHL